MTTEGFWGTPGKAAGMFAAGAWTACGCGVAGVCADRLAGVADHAPSKKKAARKRALAALPPSLSDKEEPTSLSAKPRPNASRTHLHPAKRKLRAWGFLIPRPLRLRPAVRQSASPSRHRRWAATPG